MTTQQEAAAALEAYKTLGQYNCYAYIRMHGKAIVAALQSAAHPETPADAQRKDGTKDHLDAVCKRDLGALREAAIKSKLEADIRKKLIPPECRAIMWTGVEMAIKAMSDAQGLDGIRSSVKATVDSLLKPPLRHFTVRCGDHMIVLKDGDVIPPGYAVDGAAPQTAMEGE